MSDQTVIAAKNVNLLIAQSVSVDLYRIAVKLDAYFTNQAIGRDRASWNAHIASRTDAQILLLLRNFFTNLVTFRDGTAETDPIP